MNGVRATIGLAWIVLLCLVGMQSASGEILYGADGAQGNLSHLYILDPASGAVLSDVGAIGFPVTGLAIHPNTGVLYGSTSSNSPNAPNHLITIDRTTGAGTVVGPFNVPDIIKDRTMADLTFSTAGVLHGSRSSDANLYTINLATGQAAKVGAGDDTISAFGAGLAANASNTIYLATDGDFGPLRTVDPVTGMTAEVVTLDGDTGFPISALAFNAGGVLYGSLLDNSDNPAPAQLITIDVATGHITVVGDTVDRLDAIVFGPGTPPAGTTAKLVNIATRGQVGTGSDLMIGGLIIQGTTPKTVLLRGRGPSLGGAPFFVPGPLGNPLLKVFSGSTPIAQNDNWQDDPGCSPDFICGIPDDITGTGLDPCEPNPGQTMPPPNCAFESAILITLPPGAYTVQLLGASGEAGVGLLEAFEISGGANAKLHNLSTRGVVGAGNQIMIGGFIIGGTGPKTLLVRGRGPSLGSVPFSIPNVLPDPFLTILSGSTAIAHNDNWQDAATCDPSVACGTPSQISDTGLDPCVPNPGEIGPPPNCARESAILITLQPGAYTVFLSGAGGQTGVGLFELFEIP